MTRLYLYGIIIAAIAGLSWFSLHEHGKRMVAEAQTRDYLNRVVALQNTQRGINEAYDTKINELGAINAGLVADIAGLRKRPDRLPAAARSGCAGSTGAELSAADADFLIREAAAAEAIRVDRDYWRSLAKVRSKKED